MSPLSVWGQCAAAKVLGIAQKQLLSLKLKSWPTTLWNHRTSLVSAACWDDFWFVWLCRRQGFPQEQRGRVCRIPGRGNPSEKSWAQTNPCLPSPGVPVLPPGTALPLVPRRSWLSRRRRKQFLLVTKSNSVAKVASKRFLSSKAGVSIGKSVGICHVGCQWLLLAEGCREVGTSQQARPGWVKGLREETPRTSLGFPLPLKGPWSKVDVPCIPFSSVRALWWKPDRLR